VDVCVRTIRARPTLDGIAVVQEYIRTDKNDTPRLLAQKAVVIKRFVRLLDLSAEALFLRGPLHHHVGRGREPVRWMQNVLPMILEPPSALRPQT
jgi:hypothetical protein